MNIQYFKTPNKKYNLNTFTNDKYQPENKGAFCLIA